MRGSIYPSIVRKVDRRTSTGLTLNASFNRRHTPRLSGRDRGHLARAGATEL